MRFQREVTAAVLIPAVLAVLVLAPTWAFSLLVAAAASAALLEFYALLGSAGWVVPRAAGFALFFGVLLAAHLGDLRALVVLGAAVLVVLPTLVMFGKPPVGVLLTSSAGAVFATLYVAVGGASIIGLRAIGWEPVLFLFAVVWAGDSAAYYAGRRWGRRKLAPTVSPKKTWEGLWGQIVVGLAVGATAGFLLAEGRGRSRGRPGTCPVGRSRSSPF